MAMAGYVLGCICTVLAIQTMAGFLLAAGPRCYTCPAVASPHACVNAGQCSSDQVCYTERHLTLNMSETYGLGCISKGVCSSLSQAANDSHCFSCCTTTTCNRNLCMKEICPPQRHGPFCTDVCGHCANGTQCDKSTGRCPTGCVSGYQPPLCDSLMTTCPQPYYGTHCTDVCGHCVNQEQCDKTSGKCLRGCETGFVPPYCHEAKGPRCHQCTAAFSPHSCEEDVQCLTGQECYTERYLTTGTNAAYRLGCMSEDICKIASKPANASNCFSCCTSDMCNRDLCMKVTCPKPYYGPFCTDVCGHCANGEQCDKTTGRCGTNGCADGHLPPFCLPHTCPKPYYGPYCTDVCGHCLNGNQCDKITGRCLSGCEDGFLPPFCRSACAKPWFGPECSYICGHCAGGIACDHTTGMCANGCVQGFNPPFCTEDLHPVGKDCADFKHRTNTTLSGVYMMSHGQENFPVWCDMQTVAKGWIVFQRRVDNTVIFDRNWTEYKSGFGDNAGNFWWGNDNLATFTANRQYVLRIDMRDSVGHQTYAEYQHFYIETEQNKYRLHLGTFSGNAPNYMSGHNGQYFSTKNRDNDGYARNCAGEYHSGWWFKSCYTANLNGRYTTPGAHDVLGIVWSSNSDTKSHTLKWTEMKFRHM